MACGVIESYEYRGRAEPDVVSGTGGMNSPVKPPIRNFLCVTFGSGLLLKERFALDMRGVVRLSCAGTYKREKRVRLSVL